MGRTPAPSLLLRHLPCPLEPPPSLGPGDPHTVAEGAVLLPPLWEGPRPCADAFPALSPRPCVQLCDADTCLPADGRSGLLHSRHLTRAGSWRKEEGTPAHVLGAKPPSGQGEA